MTDAAIDIVTRTVPVGTSDAEIEAAAALAAKHRRQKVVVWRVAILVAFLGLWEAAGRFGWIDPFFYAMPSTIAMRLYEWTTEGTSEGPLWYHLYVTMEEALIGFVTGSIAGVVIGVALGRNPMAADIFSIYIKVINSIPRVVLAPLFIMLFGLGLGTATPDGWRKPPSACIWNRRFGRGADRRSSARKAQRHNKRARPLFSPHAVGPRPANGFATPMAPGVRPLQHREAARR